MSVETDRRKRILFLFSDTGGGHRSATNAMIEALNLEFPGAFDCSMVDLFRDYLPPPLRYAPEVYVPLARYPQTWAAGYKAFDGKRRSRMLIHGLYPYVSRQMASLYREHPADLIVSVHPLANTSVLRTMKKRPTPFMTVVTDMVSTHAFWFDRRADLVVVPTEEAREKARGYGIPEGNIRVVGLPVAERFRVPPTDPGAIRDRLGWRHDLPVILLIGGGDGMGPMAKVAKKINEAGLPATLVAICGRNEGLRATIENLDWNMPHHVYGFTTEMPDFMAAADILVTKGGPGTISEGFIAGLPLVIYARLPGQEEGNVDYVVEKQAGVWAPKASQVVEAVRRYVSDPDALAAAADASRRVAKPDASREIARIIAGRVGVYA